MPKYVLKYKNGKKEFQSQPVEADTHRHAMIVIRDKYPNSTKDMTDFELLDNIGVIKEKDE
jgi:hypothetical protein